MFKRISEYEDKIKLYKKTIKDNIDFFQKKKNFKKQMDCQSKIIIQLLNENYGY